MPLCRYYDPLSPVPIAFPRRPTGHLHHRGLLRSRKGLSSRSGDAAPECAAENGSLAGSLAAPGAAKGLAWVSGA